MRTGSTTIPSPSTDQREDSGSRQLVVRWVFPGSHETRLASGIVIGRDPSGDAVLAGDEVSRRHLAIRVDGPVSIARDLDSRNGIHVNGKRVAEAPLEEGDVLRCGDWVGLVSATAW